MFVANNFKSSIPEMALTEEDSRFLAIVNRELNAFRTMLDQLRYLSLTNININCIHN